MSQTEDSIRNQLGDTALEFDYDREEADETDHISMPHMTMTTASAPPDAHDPMHRKDQPVRANTPKKMSKRRLNKHGRQASVGNLVPQKFLTAASSLIKLIDAQNPGINTAQFATQFRSKPQTHENQSRTSVQDVFVDTSGPSAFPDAAKSVPTGTGRRSRRGSDVSQDGDFDSPEPVPMGMKRRESTSTLENSTDRPGLDHHTTSQDAAIFMEDFQNAVQLPNDGSSKQNDNGDISAQAQHENDMKQLAMAAAQEFMTLAQENDDLSRANERLTIEMDDMRKEMMEWEDKLHKSDHKERRNSELEGEQMRLATENESLSVQVQILREKVNELQRSMMNKRRNSSEELPGLDSELKRGISTDSVSSMNRSLTSRLQHMESNMNAVDANKEILDNALIRLDDEIRLKTELQIEIENLEAQNLKLLEREEENLKQIDELTKDLDKQADITIDLQRMQSNVQQDAEEAVQDLEDAAISAQRENLELVQKLRSFTVEQNQMEQDANEARIRLKEQKLFIEALEAENKDLQGQLEMLQTSKIAEDDELFNLLHQTQKTYFIGGNNDMFAGAMDGFHSRGPSMSQSWFSGDELSSGMSTNNVLALGAGLGKPDLTSVRSVRALELIDDEPEEEEKVEDEPLPLEDTGSVVEKTDDDDNKEELRRKAAALAGAAAQKKVDTDKQKKLTAEQAAQRKEDAIKATAAQKEKEAALEKAQIAEKAAADAQAMESLSYTRIAEAEEEADRAQRELNETRERLDEAQRQVADAKKRAEELKASASNTADAHSVEAAEAALAASSAARKEIREAERLAAEAEKHAQDADAKAAETATQKEEAEKQAADAKKQVEEAQQQTEDAKKLVDDATEKASEYEELISELKIEADKMKEEERRRKKKMALIELQRANAEREFFFLTAMAVRMNLQEEVMETRPELMETIMLEQPQPYFQVAQKLNIPMNKFHIWIDAQMREKLGLVQIERAVEVPRYLKMTEKLGAASSAAKRKLTATASAAAKGVGKGTKAAKSKISEASKHTAQQTKLGITKMKQGIQRNSIVEANVAAGHTLADPIDNDTLQSAASADVDVTPEPTEADALSTEADTAKPAPDKETPVATIEEATTDAQTETETDTKTGTGTDTAGAVADDTDTEKPKETTPPNAEPPPTQCGNCAIL